MPVTGGPITKTNGPLTAGGNVQMPSGQVQFLISPDSSRDVYVADEDTDEVFEVFTPGPDQVTNNLIVSVTYLVTSGELTNNQGAP